MTLYFVLFYFFLSFFKWLQVNPDWLPGPMIMTRKKTHCLVGKCTLCSSSSRRESINTILTYFVKHEQFPVSSAKWSFEESLVKWMHLLKPAGAQWVKKTSQTKFLTPESHFHPTVVHSWIFFLCIAPRGHRYLHTLLILEHFRLSSPISLFTS